MAEETQEVKDASFWDSAGDLLLGFAGQYGNAYLTEEFGGTQPRGAVNQPYAQAEQPQSGPILSQPAQAGIGSSPLAWVALLVVGFYLVNK